MHLLALRMLLSGPKILGTRELLGDALYQHKTLPSFTTSTSAFYQGTFWGAWTTPVEDIS